jgi:hypothetical protein
MIAALYDQMHPPQVAVERIAGFRKVSRPATESAEE